LHSPCIILTSFTFRPI